MIGYQVCTWHVSPQICTKNQNIVQIRNNVIWDRQHFIEYSPRSDWMWEIRGNILRYNVAPAKQGYGFEQFYGIIQLIHHYHAFWELHNNADHIYMMVIFQRTRSWLGKKNRGLQLLVGKFTVYDLGVLLWKRGIPYLLISGFVFMWYMVQRNATKELCNVVISCFSHMHWYAKFMHDLLSKWKCC